MKEATNIQLQVLEFCKEEEKENGRFPTHLAIMAKFGWNSTMAVRSHLVALEKKGLIVKIGRYYRVANLADYKRLLEAILKADGIKEIIAAITAARKEIG